MRKLFTAVYLLYAAVIFFSLMLVACPMIVLATSVFNRKTGKRIAFWFLRAWALLFSCLSFFWLKISNVRSVDTSRAYIYTGNHSSYLDAIAVAYSIPQAFSPLGKIEMAKIPVFGWIYSRVVVMIDRNSRESREQSVKVLKQEIENGTSILIFPEGTMNQTPAILAPFYDGAFRIALETQTPVLPFVILNSRKLLPRKYPLKAKPGILHIVFGKPVEVTGMAIENVPQLRDRVFAEMENLILRTGKL